MFVSSVFFLRGAVAFWNTIHLRVRIEFVEYTRDWENVELKNFNIF